MTRCVEGGKVGGEDGWGGRHEREGREGLVGYTHMLTVLG